MVRVWQNEEGESQEMIIKGDDSGLDKLIESIEDKYYNKLSEIGREATAHAKRTGSYQNHTWRLRNACGGCVVRNGQVVDIWVTNDGNTESEEKTRNLLLYSDHPYDGLYLANGMEYASYVESRGYNVIRTNGLLYAKSQIQKKIF